MARAFCRCCGHEESDFVDLPNRLLHITGQAFSTFLLMQFPFGPLALLIAVPAHLAVGTSQELLAFQSTSCTFWNVCPSSVRESSSL